MKDTKYKILAYFDNQSYRKLFNEINSDYAENLQILLHNLSLFSYDVLIIGVILYKENISNIISAIRKIKGKYIFTSLSDPSKPMKYATVQQKITDKIYQENLRDDKGEYFGFGSHMYRHIYGMKLAEMHVDDWTIARLLGHRSLRNVKYYRKMSNKILADDTRKTRNRLSKMVLECLEGWEEEYEKIRFDDSLQ